MTNMSYRPIRTFHEEFSPGHHREWKHHEGWRPDCAMCICKLTFNLLPSIADLGPSELAPIWQMDMYITRLAAAITDGARSAVIGG
jgi:hypothetical protein